MGLPDSTQGLTLSSAALDPSTPASNETASSPSMRAGLKRLFSRRSRRRQENPGIIKLAHGRQDVAFVADGIRWRSKGNFDQLVGFVKNTCPRGQRVKVANLQGDKKKFSTITIYGELGHEELRILTETIKGLGQQYAGLISSIHDIYIFDELGYFQRAGEIGEEIIRAFTPDPSGRLLISRLACKRVRDVHDLFADILRHQQRHLRAAQLSTQVTWQSDEQIRKRFNSVRVYSRPAPGAPHGFYRDRHIIERDTCVVGGVYLGATRGGAVYVPASSAILSNHHQALKERIDLRRAEIGQALTDRQRLQEVLSLACAIFKHDSAAAVKTLLDVNRVGLDEEISIEHFARAGVGSSVHKALYTAALIEALRSSHDIYVSSHVSIDTCWNDRNTPHCWIRVCGSKAELTILDPEHHYIGPLEDTLSAPRSYLRPGDLTRLRNIRPL